MRHAKFWAALALSLLVWGLVWQVGADSPVAALAQAWRQGQPMPRVTETDPDISVAQAYGIQKALVTELYPDEPAGFKAGLTSARGQQAFGVSEPIAGVLPPGSGLTANTEGHYQITLAEYVRPMQELELGYRFKHPLSQPLADIAELQAMVGEVVPVVELPDLGFANPEGLRGVDVIAANAAARHYLAGQALPVAPDRINQLQVVLTRDRSILGGGQASQVMGDQWQALLWLVNHTVSQGWTIRPDQILITGAIGKMLPLEAGCYRVDVVDFSSLHYCTKP